MRQNEQRCVPCIQPIHTHAHLDIITNGIATILAGKVKARAVDRVPSVCSHLFLSSLSMLVLLGESLVVQSTEGYNATSPANTSVNKHTPYLLLQVDTLSADMLREGSNGISYATRLQAVIMNTTIVTMTSALQLCESSDTEIAQHAAAQ